MSADSLKTSSAPSDTAATASHPARISKQAAIEDLLRRPNGASIAELTEATGWLPHSLRAALTGLRQRGRSVRRNRDADNVSRYSIAAAG